MVRCMLWEKKLTNNYWAEVVSTTVYVLNRSPTSSLQDKIPQEAWDGNKVNVSHFRIFGSIDFSHVLEKLRKKLDDRSEKCIFVGYSEQSKAYRLYNPISKKFIISRDVKFFENKSWFDHVDETSNQIFYPPQSPRLQVQEQPANSENGTSSSTDSASDQTSSEEGQKTRSIREIYEQEHESEQQNMFAFISTQPTYFEEAVKEKHWVEAMNQEIAAIEKNQTWELADLPRDKTKIGVKWVYKTKLASPLYYSFLALLLLSKEAYAS